MDLKELERQVKSYQPGADLKLLDDAYQFAAAAHQGQKRRSGEDFITHPLNVAAILAELQLDVVTIAAALLHDVVEDTPISLDTIREIFGDEVALLVDGVTKLSRLEYKTKEEQQAETLRKMFLAMAQDIRVILIKLADRLHNMRTLKHHPPEKQQEIARETLEIFAPLAHRLGIFRLKWELEDQSLRYLEPERYYELVNSINMKRREREEYIQQVVKILGEKLAEGGIKADIQGRPKHFYSIYNKMMKQGKELSEIYDLIAVRVIVDSVKDCYAVLGLVHALWKPIPGRFKDYIAMPKPNMYQSLHTTVIGPNGDPFEIQIRTWEMHRTAEYGIAAHWRYKEDGGNSDPDFEKKLTWLRQLLDWQREMRDPREFMESLKIDLFSDRVYVFTPKGDVVELPAGSVPIDFAYRVHTDVGHRCTGARVNGRIVPLDYKLKTGDIVEVLTTKGSRPSRDWLHIVKTSQAKNRIRQWFRKEEREKNLARGREMLEKECQKQGLDPEEILKPALLQEAARKFNVATNEDLYVMVGDGVIPPSQVLGRLKGEEEVPPPAEVAKTAVKPWSGYGKPSHGIRIKGLDNLDIRLAHCCNPLPGDAILGYITRGRGISVHRIDCPNINHHRETEKERIIEVAWGDTSDATYQVHIEALALDRPNLAMDIMAAVADTKTIINSVHARATRNDQALVDLKIEIRSLEHLNYIMDKIRRIRDVMEVKRVIPG
ncbi:MAG: diphosphokinase / guanosine-3,5-bis(diphosphate) 3-diphosphatase [Moorella sp. (in: firmicutes)]|uniref:RelA/SpoT family protein n=1 Tax=unclassified Neomoorella TaxID=2676739 RepID=UPI0010FFAD39|nr:MULTISPECIES: bifunctional (p)ppGpp synthetase/guanosine-3',5'-bis(diphosphate) 3'-pyrophosphohydrolase [unclassified Moorella (in: firmicutes)]MDK2816393.1 diphosphokinase / guanosine-3,5-bis(diphosphate) 3-diphosphatase [Moorella sp. (in: firmicutes)]MDK2895377.1 diphosphokinase / guanosine-3,5-bis(diphosphate) 3-diphosphatase [Moorella sp. (in: firmicutes)]GEA16102.1 (p)ppGpp synthetase [Moorella sp. E308F]GEA19053.1 (p)ppGpp synthetase [Moorella sp. E306M]